MQITTHRTLLKNAFCLHPNSLTLSKLLPSPLFSTASVFTYCPNSPEHTPQWLMLGMLLIASPRKRNRPYGLNHKKIVCSLNQVPRNTGSQGRLRIFNSIIKDPVSILTPSEIVSSCLLPRGHKTATTTPNITPSYAATSAGRIE